MWYIKIPINEVWELLNKPHRFYKTLYEEVGKLPIGNYYLLDLDAVTKEEIITRIKKVAWYL